MNHNNQPAGASRLLTRGIKMEVNVFVRLFLGHLFLLAALNPGSAYSLEVSPKKIRGNQKEKPVSVLQRRFFKKALRPEVGLMVGTMLNEAYVKSETRGIRLSFFLSEWIGLETQFVDTSVVSSEDRKSLNLLKFRRRTEDVPEGEDPEKTVTPDPEVNPIRQMIDVSGILTPFYGKANFFNIAIVYTDIYLNLGVASVNTDQGDKTAVVYGVGERFYLMKSFSVRLDFRMRSFNEKRAGKSSRRDAMSADLGFSYFFL